jgi:hypothetical protein
LAGAGHRFAAAVARHFRPHPLLALLSLPVVAVDPKTNRGRGLMKVG